MKWIKFLLSELKTSGTEKGDYWMTLAHGHGSPQGR